MVSVVLVIAVFNLVLGFGLAVLLERQIVIPVPRIHWRPRYLPETPNSEERPSDSGPEIKPVTEQELDAELIPPAWLTVLDNPDVPVGSLIKTPTNSICSGMTDYLGILVHTEHALRAAVHAGTDASCADAIDAFVQHTIPWSRRLAECRGELSALRGSLGVQEQTVVRLNDVLAQLSSSIPRQCGVMSIQWQAQNKAETMAALYALAATVHQLRDAMLETLATIMRDENQLETLDRRERYDPLTHLYNRLGMELVFRNWRENSDHARELNLAILDLDDFGDVNRSRSLRTGDRILGSVGRVLGRLMADGGAVHQVTRVAGQKFLVFFADMNTSDAAANTQAIRQAIEATTFRVDGEDVNLTLTAGVLQVCAGAPVSELCPRLNELRDAAKAAGRNQVVIGRDAGPEPAPPGSRPATPRVVPIL